MPVCPYAHILYVYINVYRGVYMSLHLFFWWSLRSSLDLCGCMIGFLAPERWYVFCFCVSMYAPIHVCMYECMCVYVYVCMYLCFYVCMHTCMHASIHAYVHTCMHVYVCIYQCMHIHYVFMYKCMHAIKLYSKTMLLQLVTLKSCSVKNNIIANSHWTLTPSDWQWIYWNVLTHQ